MEMPMAVLECNSCNEGPCRMVESVTLDDEWISICTKGVYNGYAEWTRMKEVKNMLVIRQPEAMKHEIQEFLGECMNTGSGSKNLEIIQSVGEIIDHYTKEVGDHI
jgi:hypothetical protein